MAEFLVPLPLGEEIQVVINRDEPVRSGADFEGVEVQDALHVRGKQPARFERLQA
jgi:hypothetical protein